MDFVKGQLVRSKAGRDKTRTLAVLAVEEHSSLACSKVALIKNFLIAVLLKS